MLRPRNDNRVILICVARSRGAVTGAIDHPTAIRRRTGFMIRCRRFAARTTRRSCAIRRLGRSPRLLRPARLSAVLGGDRRLGPSPDLSAGLNIRNPGAVVDSRSMK